MVLARSHVFPSEGEKDGIIRVDDLEQCCAMQSDGNVGSKGVCVCVCVCHFFSISLFSFSTSMLCSSIHALL